MRRKSLKILSALLAVGTLTACSGGGGASGGTSVADSSDGYTENTNSPVSSAESSSESAAEETSEPAVTPINTEPDYEWDKVVALTFDDGPNTTTTNEVLDVLEKHQVVASFFLIGKNITDESAKTVKRAYDLGCEIDNHSKSHDYMNKMDAENIKAEIQFVDDKVFEITGEHTKFFRPPYIAIGDVMWENISLPFISGLGCDDWNDKVSVEKRVATITEGVKDGTIILMHDAQGNSKTVEAIDRIIPELKEQGYKFTTVSGLFEAKGITPVTKMIYSNAAQEGMWG